MAVAGLQYQSRQALGMRQRLDALDNHRPDPAPAMRGARVHALDLADAAVMALERAAGHHRIAVAGDEDSGVAFGHLLDRQVEDELGRREFEQGGVELGHQDTDIVLQGRFDRDGERHRQAPCGTSTWRTVATSCRRSKPSFS